MTGTVLLASVADVTHTNAIVQPLQSREGVPDLVTGCRRISIKAPLGSLKEGISSLCKQGTYVPSMKSSSAKTGCVFIRPGFCRIFGGEVNWNDLLLAEND
jgi:hypothetical protein